MCQSCEALPDGYKPHLTVDLKNNKRLAVGVNAAALVIAAVMAVCIIILTYIKW